MPWNGSWGVGLVAVMLAGCPECGTTVGEGDSGHPGDAAAGDGATIDLVGRDTAGLDAARPDRAGTDRAADDQGSADRGGPGGCSAVPQFDDGLAPSREVHVASTGSDTANDGSSGSPYATIRRGVQAATPGTAVRIHAGTYAGGGWLEGVAGTASAPIWIGGAPGEARPVISGGTVAMQLVQPRYVVLHDLEIHGQSQNGLNVDDGGDFADDQAAHHVIFRHLSIHDIGSDGNQDCLKLSGLNDYIVVDCDIARCGGNMSGSGIDQVGCHRGVIARNRFEQMSAHGVQCKGGSFDIEIRWNIFVNAGERGVQLGGNTDLALFRPPLSTTQPNSEARNIRVIANLFVGASAPIAFTGCVGCLVANNTVIDPGRWLIRILQEQLSSGSYTFETGGDCRVANNLFHFNHSVLSGEHINIGANTAPASYAFDHNLWYAHDSPADSPVPLPTTETGGVVGQDPQFIAVGDESYHVAAGSPARSAGIAIDGVVGDLSGSCYLDPPAIGAYEVSH